MKEQLIARWNTFSDKEKSILSVIALVMLCFIFYAFVWLPTQHGRERLARVIPEKQAKLMLMRSQAADIERLRGQYKSLSSAPDALKAAIEVSAKFHGLTPSYPASAKNGDSGRLAIALSQISFDTWVKWAEALQSQNHIRIQSCRITPNGSTGQVSVDAIFVAAE